MQAQTQALAQMRALARMMVLAPPSLTLSRPPLRCTAAMSCATASLIDNAIKYAGPGATVDVQTRLQAGMVSIAVRDNGPGIRASEHTNVLQRFYRRDTTACPATA